ncbi:hypothetical protein PanWU01x14_079540 [Parasponia andersonii]|uniref:Uncharacterized protein n=1 Tax=Parasponia andersonii TaxID=3476 RepID=A0A2P5DBF6_PARAD|nr:hypothetical protein PanWU01x14_079540 [Parasponia andersonii]
MHLYEAYSYETSCTNSICQLTEFKDLLLVLHYDFMRLVNAEEPFNNGLKKYVRAGGKILRLVADRSHCT